MMVGEVAECPIWCAPGEHVADVGPLNTATLICYSEPQPLPDGGDVQLGMTRESNGGPWRVYEMPVLLITGVEGAHAVTIPERVVPDLITALQRLPLNTP